MSKPKVIIIAGPTSSGKTAISIELAKKLNTEIISCDSMQIYKDMNIGTAKPTIAEMQGIKHYMIDEITPDKDFNVVEYITMVKPIISKIVGEGKIPVLVGGTGLYIDALINNTDFSEVTVDEDYRRMIYDIAEKEGNEKIYNMLKKIDEPSAERISINDTKRIVRALEIYNSTGKTMTYYNEQSRKKESEYDYYLFAREISREDLYERINNRVDIMLENGLINEAKGLYEKYNMSKTAKQAIGYKEVKEYLDGIITYDEMVEKLKMETRRYAKRQMTWFRRYKQMVWLTNGSEIDNISEICSI